MTTPIPIVRPYEGMTATQAAQARAMAEPLLTTAELFGAEGNPSLGLFGEHVLYSRADAVDGVYVPHAGKYNVPDLDVVVRVHRFDSLDKLGERFGMTPDELRAALTAGYARSLGDETRARKDPTEYAIREVSIMMVGGTRNNPGHIAVPGYFGQDQRNGSNVKTTVERRATRAEVAAGLA